MRTGYKEMLRDRLPVTVNFALKWCKAKERWLDHVYNSSVNIYEDKDCRKEATRIILGLSKKNRQFNFHDTIDWDNLTEDDQKYWKYVEEWVDWFRKTYLYIQNEYTNSLTLGLHMDMIKTKIKSNFLMNLDEEWKEKLCNYLIYTIQWVKK